MLTLTHTSILFPHTILHWNSLDTDCVFFLALTHLLCIVYLNNYVLPHVTICFLFYQGMHLISIILAIVYPLHNMHKVL